MEADLSDEDNDNTKPPSWDHPPRTEPSELLDEPRTGQQHQPPPQNPQPSTQEPGPPPAQTARVSPTRIQLPSAGTGAAGYGCSGGHWPSPPPPLRPPGVFSPPRGLQIVSHPIVVSHPDTPRSSPTQQWPQPQMPLYSLPARSLPPTYTEAEKLQDDEEDGLGPSVPPPPPLRIRRTMPPHGHVPPPHPPPPHPHPPPLPLPIRLQEGPWRAFAGPRIAARPLRPLHPRPETGPYDAPHLASEPATLRVRHNPYGPPPPPPGAPPQMRAAMASAAYRALTRQRGGGVPGHSYTVAHPPWIDPRLPPQRPMYGLGRMPQMPQLPQRPPAAFHQERLPQHPQSRPRSSGAVEAREVPIASAGTTAAAALTQPAAVVEQSGESPSGGGGGGGGDGEGSTASPPTAFPHPDHPHIEVTVAVRVPRPAASDGTPGGAGSCGAGSASGTIVRGSNQAASEDAQAQPAVPSESRSGYMPGPVRGVFDVPRYLAGRDCIFCNGRWLSRSNFERVGGSKMAKWYRSIRIMPTLEPLGEWLERQGMPVTKGPARRSSKRVAPEGSDEQWLLGALAARGPLTSARDSVEPEDASMAFHEYEPFARLARTPVLQGRSVVTSPEVLDGVMQQALPIAPLVAAGHLRPAGPPPQPTMTSPRQSLASLPRRVSGGPSDMGRVYGIPIRRTETAAGGTPSTGYDPSFEAVTMRHQQHLHQHHQQQNQQHQRAPEADAEAEEDVATLRWLLRQTGRAAAASASAPASASATARPNLTPQLSARKSDVMPGPSTHVKASLRWVSSEAAVEAEVAAAAEEVVMDEEPVLFRPTRRQRFIPARREEYDEAFAGAEVVEELLPEPGLLPPPRRRPPAGGGDSGDGSRGAGGIGVTSVEPPPRRKVLLQPDLTRMGELVAAGGAAPGLVRASPTREQLDEPPAAVGRAPGYAVYARHPPSLTDMPYYRHGRRVVTMEAPSAASRGVSGGIGSASASTPATAPAAAVLSAMQSSSLQQRSVYLDHPPPPQQLRQALLHVQGWEKKEEVIQEVDGGKEPEQEVEEVQERYWRYDRSRGHASPPLLPEHQQRYQQLLQHQAQYPYQQELQRHIDQQQRAELEEYALRHRAFRRHRQQDRGSEDKA